MQLPIGARIGCYEIAAPLGAGGMGEVYRARDTSLNRDVALKILPQSFASDADRAARFTREAQTLAALNHPHIAQIHGVEESGGTRALVMELVDGETLADRIARGPIPIDEAIPIAQQIADALEAAHEQGIVHRDLKPANVKLRPDGTVKVLDFGLAKAMDAHAGSTPASPAHVAPTITSPAMTQAGVILGTAAYMSPEQARGQTVDRRADLWAFGCVLFEMLTGNPPFAGDTVTDLLSAIVSTRPAWSALPADTPVSVRRVMERSLEKDLRARLPHAAVAKFLLQERNAFADAATSTSARGGWGPLVLGGAALLVLIAAIAAWTLKPVPAVQPVRRFEIGLPEDQAFTRIGRHIVALSPDGSDLVYVANQRLYLRPLDKSASTAIRGTDDDPTEVVFSPDGNSVAYWAQGSLKRVDLAGGTPVTICEAIVPFGMSWTSDGLLFGQLKGIYAVDPTPGAEPKLLISASDEETLATPSRVGERLLFTRLARSANLAWDTAAVVVETPGKRDRQTILAAAADARLVANRYLMFNRGNGVYAVRFDPQSAQASGEPVVVIENVAFGTPSGAAHFTLASDGALVYLERAVTVERTLVWVDRTGAFKPIGTDSRPYVQPRLSPDGTRAVMHSNDGDVWVWDIQRGTPMRATFDATIDRDPVWTGDGRSFVYLAGDDRGGRLFMRAADGGGSQRPVSGDIGNHDVLGLTPDDKRVLLRAGTDLFVLTLGTDESPTPLLKSAANEQTVAISPDGRWFAFNSNQSGRSEIYVAPFHDPDGGRWQASANGGNLPLWSRDGRELYYQSPERRVMAVRVDTSSSMSLSKPEELFDVTGYVTGAHGAFYDVHADGRFFMLRGSGTVDQIRKMNVIENFVAELTAKMEDVR